jgi:hypothetical protein
LSIANPAFVSFLQVEINEKMRGILIDWLVEVHLKFKVRAAWSLQVPALF